MNRINTTAQKDIRDRAQASLLDSLGAVQKALSTLPASMPGRAVDAFIASDPILSMLNKQLLEARSHASQLIAAFGPGDAMLEALMVQIGAIEQAYNERLALIRKKREETSRTQKEKRQLSQGKEFRTEGKSLQDVRLQMQSGTRQDNGTLWLLAFLILRNREAFAKPYGLVPKAA